VSLRSSDAGSDRGDRFRGSSGNIFPVVHLDSPSVGADAGTSVVDASPGGTADAPVVSVGGGSVSQAPAAATAVSQ
jgi:hypothetical protein